MLPVRWRRGWDSNPRCFRTPLFESGTINHSDTSPRERIAKARRSPRDADTDWRPHGAPDRPLRLVPVHRHRGLHEVGAVRRFAAWAGIVARHDALLRSAIEATRGVVVKTEGDAFFAAFDAPGDAVAAAVDAQRAIAAEAWPDDLAVRVRMGIHLGEGRLREGRGAGDPEDYVGIDVNYTARIAAAGNGGQIVLSDALVAALPSGLTELPGMGDVSLADEGLRSVKDFDDPAPLHRLVVPGAADDARALRTLETPTNLPGDVTSFVGREAELAGVDEDLRASRIVTLTGPGGSGKTRLALAAAREVRTRFPHGVWFVDLAAVRDATLLETAIAAALGVRESSESTVDDALRAFLRDRTALLVLDNLEQLLPAVAERVALLVRSAPEVRVLATSRELLRIAGERGRPVPPLALESGVALFVDRAREHRPDLVLDERRSRCDHVDRRSPRRPAPRPRAGGRPIRLLTPAQILERLGRSLDLGGRARDLPERQRTLRGAIAWSHELLPPEERRLFARLGVFASTWTTETAALVADPEGDLGVDIVDGLESLVDKSLVRVEPDEAADATGGELRFSLHPLIREYALERLDERGERAAVEAAFAGVCVDVAESSGRSILGRLGEASVARLDREERNLRAAVDWSVRNDDPDTGLRIVAATWRWYQQRGRLREGRGLLGQLLELPHPDADARVRVAALAAEGSLAYWMDDFPASREAYRRRLEMAEAIGDPAILAEAHYDLGFLAMVAQQGDELRAHEEQALALFEAAGDENGVIRARQALVLALFLTGDYEGAQDLEARNLEAFRGRGSQFEVADSLTLLSAISWRLGEPLTAWDRASEGLRFFWASNADRAPSATWAWPRSSRSRTGTPSWGHGSPEGPIASSARRA